MTRDLPYALLVSLLMVTGCSPDTAEPPPAVGETAAEQPVRSGVLTYDGAAEGIPVSASYPDVMEVAALGSGEGVGVFFSFVPRGTAMDQAQLHIFLPAGGSSPDELRSFVTGPGGVIEANGWTLDGSRDGGGAELPYSWITSVLDVRTDGQQGHILIGQVHGQAVRVTVLYPTGEADAYWRSARTVLDSLQFNASMLPIRASGL